jgi:uncharacterized phiE125 gp8 family phage protein
MNPILVDGPAVEPVTVPEMRAWLRLDDAAEDALVASLIKAARLAVETAARRVLIESRWRAVLDAWPAGRVVRLPLSPVIAVDTVEVRDAAGGAHALTAGAYRIAVASDPARLIIDTSAPEPGITPGGIAIDFRAGFGAAAAAVPEPLRHAVRLLVARWFEHRGDDAEPARAALPDDVLTLVSPYRRARL